jgi:N-acetylmuramic acid 6-phosphate etherase
VNTGEPIATETIDPATRALDSLETAQLVATLIESNQRSLDAARAAAPAVVRAVEAVVARLERGGRLHYVGAGTSGRLGALDAAELPPTFGIPPGRVCAHIAGGASALLRAVEGAEDDREAGIRTIERHVAERDAVVGISASGGAPFVVAAVEAARARGAATIAITSVAEGPLARAAEIAVILETGAEPIAGSTRLRAGTAQKIVLNTLSTAVMVRLGKVYENLMVDVIASNAKLRRRAERLVALLGGVDPGTASRLLREADGAVKPAVVMARRGVDAATARNLLAVAGDRLRAVIDPERGASEEAP